MNLFSNHQWLQQNIWPEAIIVIHRYVICHTENEQVTVFMGVMNANNVSLKNSKGMSAVII